MHATATAAPFATAPTNCLHCPQPARDHSSLCSDCHHVAETIEATFPAPRTSWTGPNRGPTIHWGGLTLLLDPHADIDYPQVVAWGVGDPAALQPMTIEAARDLGARAMVDFPCEVEHEAFVAIKRWHAEDC